MGRAWNHCELADGRTDTQMDKMISIVPLLTIYRLIEMQDLKSSAILHLVIWLAWTEKSRLSDQKQVYMHLSQVRLSTSAALMNNQPVINFKASGLHQIPSQQKERKKEMRQSFFSSSRNDCQGSICQPRTVSSSCRSTFWNGIKL